MNTLQSKGITMVKIDANKASIVAVSGGEKSLVIDGEYKYSSEDGILYVRPNIRNEIKIRMPKNIRIVIRIKHGDVRIADMDEPVRVQSELANVSLYRCNDVEISNYSGKTSVDDAKTKVRVTSESGPVVLTGIAAVDTVIKTENGNISAAYSSIPVDTTCMAQTGKGIIQTSSTVESSLVIVSVVGFGSNKKVDIHDGIIMKTLSGNINISVISETEL